MLFLPEYWFRIKKVSCLNKMCIFTRADDLCIKNNRDRDGAHSSGLRDINKDVARSQVPDPCNACATIIIVKPRCR